MRSLSLYFFFAIQTPSKYWILSLLPSTIFTPTLIVSPGENSVIFLLAVIFELQLYLYLQCFSFFFSKYFFQRSGLWRCVIASDWDKRHPFILAWSPENRTSGTFLPSQSLGLVYWGYSKKIILKNFHL